MKVGIQGIRGAFHETAALEYFGEEIECVMHHSFEDLVQALHQGETDHAVMAIENTIAGSLLGNYRLLSDFPLTITGEVYLNIQMCLMTRKKVEMDQIKVVESHPIALQQCLNYIDLNLQKAERKEAFDTAGSALKLSQSGDESTAVIAAERCAEIYGLHIMAKSIETNRQNFTRFLVLQRNDMKKVENANKSTISFQLNHVPGSLSNVLHVFNSYSINLTKIQSIPIIGQPYHYNFIVDLEWEKDDVFNAAIREIQPQILKYKLMGIYKKGKFELNQFV